MGISVIKKVLTFFLPVGISVLLFACSNEHTKLNYKTAEGYFVLNTVKNEGGYEKKFTTKEDFDKYFGMATTMNTTPTAINFDKEFVAAYIAPETDMETTINVDSVIWNGNQTEMWLDIKTGKKLSYTIRPVKLLLIDKKYDKKLNSFVTGYQPNN